MSRPVWVLGAGDPEMEAIAALLRECGQEVVHAESAPGVRVHPGNAYSAQVAECVGAALWHRLGRPSGFASASERVAFDRTVIVVECAIPVVPPEVFGHGGFAGPRVRCLVIDHHRPGDPGHGRPPGEFLRSSSLGQVILELAHRGALRGPDGSPAEMYIAPVCGEDGEDAGDRWVVNGYDSTLMGVIPERLVLIAAADHCLGAAYAGKCPGVDPEALGRFRAEERARWQSREEPGITAEIIMARIAATQAALAAAPELVLSEGYPVDEFGQVAAWSGYPEVGSEPPTTVRDMRRAEPWPELPEAATRLGVGYMSGPLTSERDPRRKFTCSGTPGQVREWMLWAVRHGLTGVYGDAERGFAGGYEVP